MEKLATKTYGNNPLNLGDKNSENKKNFKRLIQVILKVEATFLMMDYYIIISTNL